MRRTRTPAGDPAWLVSDYAKTIRPTTCSPPLVAAHRADPDGFGLDQVAKLGAGLLFAGHETTVAAIDAGWCCRQPTSSSVTRCAATRTWSRPRWRTPCDTRP
ncbi:MAG: hypothetical protein ACRDRK_16960 [Pseudonocardia sp.]